MAGLNKKTTESILKLHSIVRDDLESYDEMTLARIVSILIGKETTKQLLTDIANEFKSQIDAARDKAFICSTLRRLYLVKGEHERAEEFCLLNLA
mmetsp:Transcript_13994/g.26198  ORF Transcript_13994/g.26198 Transcript_13994/m.26198 type:complete len:95 (-) Transcript_13994:266-550(-)